MYIHKFGILTRLDQSVHMCNIHIKTDNCVLVITFHSALETNLTQVHMDQ